MTEIAEWGCVCVCVCVCVWGGGVGGGWGHVLCVIMTQCIRKSISDSPLNSNCEILILFAIATY